MKISTSFMYNCAEYLFDYDDIDPSSLGCIVEIVCNDEYLLHKFENCVGKTFIDIGANCGVATIILAKQNPESTIYCFEPCKKTFETLCNNIKINNLKNVIPHNKAVSKEELKTISLFLNPEYSGGNTTYADNNTINNYFNKPIESYDVECISLDEIIANNNVTEVELLKIDCEGAEYDILYNSACLKQKIIKNMVGEFHNLKYNLENDNKNKGDELISFCKPYIENIFKIFVLTM